MLDFNLDEKNREFEDAHPREILTWAWETFGPDIAATSSFQTQSLPLLHLIGQHTPEMPVLFLDTGFHFPETLAFRDRLRDALNLNIRSLLPSEGHDGFRRQHGDLHQRDPDMCCYINKVEPLDAAKRGLKAWITGIRRDQTPQRANTPIVSIDEGGRVKICPLATWDKREVWRYIGREGLEEHPLTDKGYMSIGCAPCTRAVSIGEDYRAGRWAGKEKTECGLHYPTQALTDK